MYSNEREPSDQPLESSIRASLGIEDDLDSQIAGSWLKKVVFHTIEFEVEKKPLIQQLEELKTKYLLLKDPSKPVFQKSHAVTQAKHSDATECGPVDGAMWEPEYELSWNRDEHFPRPKFTLYDGEVDLHWNQICNVGAGLHNMGNTCFLNSVLQCLTYTPPLTNYLLSCSHSNKCHVGIFCMMCELERHIKRCFTNKGQIIRPQPIISRLRSIAKHMQWGRQEDSHEFLRYVVEAMLRSCLDGYRKLDPLSKSTTVVNKIFGGYLRSQVRCSNCNTISNTYEPFLDISLDIKNVSSVKKALDKFVDTESLFGDNSYDCPRCQLSCPATKHFTIHKPSNVLTIQLKRFDHDRVFGGKISRHIDFRSQLDIRPYMSVEGGAVQYQLYAVLVHSGFGCNSGHYYCHVHAPDNEWYCMDDAHVSRTTLERVSQTEAYLLFYIKSYRQMCAPFSQTSYFGPNLKTGNFGEKLSAKIDNGVMPSNNVDTLMIRDDIHTATTMPTNNSRAPGSTVTQMTLKPRRSSMTINCNHDGFYHSIRKNGLRMRNEASSVAHTGEYTSGASEKRDKTLQKQRMGEKKKSSPHIANARPEVTDAPKHESARQVLIGAISAPSEGVRISRSVSIPLDLCAPLSLSTNAARVNATLPWRVQHRGRVISPSTGSEFESNTSISSTTGWKIYVCNTLAKQLVPARQHAGWKVNVMKTLLKKREDDSNSQPETERNTERNIEHIKSLGSELIEKK